MAGGTAGVWSSSGEAVGGVGLSGLVGGGVGGIGTAGAAAQGVGRMSDGWGCEAGAAIEAVVNEGGLSEDSGAVVGGGRQALHLGDGRKEASISKKEAQPREFQLRPRRANGSLPQVRVEGVCVSVCGGGCIGGYPLAVAQPGEREFAAGACSRGCERLQS